MRSLLIASAAGRAVVLALAVVALAAAAPVAAQEVTVVFVPADGAYLLGAGPEPATKITVANPTVADVQVITPVQFLVSGKAPGRTSLMVFSAANAQVRRFEIVVHPAPALPTASSPAAAEPHVVLVHRGDKVSERFFLRGRSDSWIELGTVKDTEPAKK